MPPLLSDLHAERTAQATRLAAVEREIATVQRTHDEAAAAWRDVEDQLVQAFRRQREAAERLHRLTSERNRLRDAVHFTDREIARRRAAGA